MREREERSREREKDRDRERERVGERERETDRETERQRETERDVNKERGREREREIPGTWGGSGFRVPCRPDKGGTFSQGRRREGILRKWRAARNACLLLSVLIDFAPVLASRVGEQIPAQST